MATDDYQMKSLMRREPTILDFMPHGDERTPFPTHYDPCPSCSYKLQNDILMEENARLNRLLDELREVVRGGSTES